MFLLEISGSDRVERIDFLEFLGPVRFWEEQSLSAGQEPSTVSRGPTSAGG